MTRYSVSKIFRWQGQVTKKVTAVMRMYGLTVDRLRDNAIRHKCIIEAAEGDIVYITGPSGSGKSVLLKQLAECVPARDKVNLNEIALPGDKTVIDCIDGDVVTGLRFLSCAGLNDVFCVLNQPAHLSDGQKWRFRLAAALASGKKFVFADEFCCELDRVTTAVISYNIRKFADRTGVTFILAASQDDMLFDLQPDVLVVKELSGPAEVIYRK